MSIEDDEEQRSIKEKAFRKIMSKTIQSIVRNAMGFSISSKMQFKTKVTLQKLIDYKFVKESDEYKFKKFLSIADDIVDNINIMFPFINLDGIDLSWTTDEIQNKLFEIFETAPEVNLVNCPRLSEQERKLVKKKASQEQKELEIKLENILRRMCNIPKDIKMPRSLPFRVITREFSKDAQEARTALSNFEMPPSPTRNYVQSPFELEILEEFPKLKRFYCGSYSKFADVMRQIKKDYDITSI